MGVLCVLRVKLVHGNSVRCMFAQIGLRRGKIKEEMVMAEKLWVTTMGGEGEAMEMEL